MATPWYTSSDLISAVQRKIAMPLNQRTFTSDDILAFANEELVISQVPDILLYHQEYFVWSEDVTLNPNQQRYAIPERAMGMKLRDLYYVDNNGNLFEMTRINPDDKAYWQRESGSINSMQKYYLEGNDIVLAPQNISNPTGSLRFSYFIRPNQLVDITRASIISSFYTPVAVTYLNMVAGDTLTLGTNGPVFTAVTGSPATDEEFQISTSDIVTATNLMNAINADATYNATIINSSFVSINFTHLSSFYSYSANQTVETSIVSSNSNGLLVNPSIGVNSTTGIASNIVAGNLVDLLQTKSGHKLYAKDVLPLSISTNSVLFNNSDVPLNMVVGDYFCEQYECIIPQIPTDLHNGLAERVCARILEAQGDMQGMQAAAAKIADIKHSEGVLTENRVDGSTEKVNQRKSPLSFQRMGVRRRI